MVIDASAIVAIIAREPDADELAARSSRAGKTFVTPIVLYEATAGLARALNTPIENAAGLVDRFIEQVGAQTAPIDDAMGRIAVEAFARFGKGRHRAGLNMGDCFSYAAAKALSEPLLFKGDDFPLTDIKAA